MSDASHRKPARKTMQRLAHAVVWCLAVVASTLPVLGERASAAPSDLPDPPLPVVSPRPSSWTPKFPFPYDANRKDVTDADITAEREMCQWFNSRVPGSWFVRSTGLASISLRLVTIGLLDRSRRRATP